MEFYKKGISIILNKQLGESDEIFYKRGFFIINQSKLDDFQELEKLSKIWSNYKFKKCNYSNDLIKLVTNMEKNMN